MDQLTQLSDVRTLFVALYRPEFKEVWSIWNDKSDVDELKKVVFAINNVLQDADADIIYGQLSAETHESIKKFIAAVNFADVLMAEFLTLARKMGLLKKDEFIKELLFFFLQNDPHRVACTMSNVFRNIMNNLDNASGPHGLTRDETYSYYNTETIGRYDDVDEIVAKLLHSCPALTIFSKRMTGRTTLARLAFDHEKIKSQFDLRSWATLDRWSLDVKATLAQILESATGQKSNECSIDAVVNRVRQVLSGKRFLIVLDNIFIERRNELQKVLRHLIDGGKAGSKIMILLDVGAAGSNSVKYHPEGLSDLDSWDLFRRAAFGEIQHRIPNRSDMDKLIIGKHIIKFCNNHPLTIKQIGSLLYKQDIRKWQQVQTFVLANCSRYQNGIQRVEIFNYDNLESPLKSCFSYCSVFPKGFRINKKMLIKLWKTQGYVVPLRKGQSVEDASEEYILVLLKRCFFQDVERNELGEIYSFKLHDIMHDLASEVSVKEIRQASDFTREVVKRV